LALLLIAKVTEQAREKVMVRSGRIGHYSVVHKFIFEIIEREVDGARNFAAVKFAASRKCLLRPL
jgi:hypothetical protein